jgi:hypothetical protein
MSLQRSHSDQDLFSKDHRLTRTRLNSSSTSSDGQRITSTTTSSTRLSSIASTSNYGVWHRLEQWLDGIAVITFDISVGHSIEVLLPHHLQLTDEEQSRLSYLSFPDTNSKCSGDIQYHFRFRHRSSLSSFHQHYNTKVPATLKVDSETIFGHVNFRQTRTKTLQRGYLQKSLVILTKLPFFALYSTLVQCLAVHYFQHGPESLESCCQWIDTHWPEPEPGKTLFLPLFDRIFQVRIPTHGDKPFSSADIIQFRSVLHETAATNIPRQTFKYPIDDDTDVDAYTTESDVKCNNSDELVTCSYAFVHIYLDQ